MNRGEIAIFCGQCYTGQRIGSIQVNDCCQLNHTGAGELSELLNISRSGLFQLLNGPTTHCVAVIDRSARLLPLHYGKTAGTVQRRGHFNLATPTESILPILL